MIEIISLTFRESYKKTERCLPSRAAVLCNLYQNLGVACMLLQYSLFVRGLFLENEKY